MTLPVVNNTTVAAHQGGTSTPVMPLVHCLDQWVKGKASSWVLQMVKRGYHLQFAQKPPAFLSIVESTAVGDKAHVLREEIATILRKEAIHVVPRTEAQEGFYSRYFLVPKKGGGLRTILDLRALYSYFRCYNFKMMTPRALLHSVHQNDWFTSIDLKDAYFQIHIYSRGLPLKGQPNSWFSPSALRSAHASSPDT